MVKNGRNWGVFSHLRPKFEKYFMFLYISPVIHHLEKIGTLYIPTLDAASFRNYHIKAHLAFKAVKTAFVEIRKSLPDRLFGLQQKSVCSNFGDDFQAPHFILLTFISKMFRGKV